LDEIAAAANGQTMGLVAAVAGFFTLGAYLGRTYESFERI